MNFGLKQLWTIISLLLISNVSFAENAIFLDKDSKAPFSGYLLPEDKTKELYNAVLERDSFKYQLDLTNKNIEVYRQEKQILLDQNLKLVESGAKNYNLNTLEKAAWFTGGIVLVILAIKGAQELRQ